MTATRRRKLRLPETPKAPAAEVKTTTRRVRGRVSVNDDGPVYTERQKALRSTLDDAAESRQKMQREILRLADEIRKLDSTACEALVELKLSHYTVPGVGTYTYEPRKTRGSTVVDVKKFRKAVGEEVFMQVAEVSVTEARKVLPGKELDKVVTVIPAKPGEKVFLFNPAKA